MAEWGEILFKGAGEEGEGNEEADDAGREKLDRGFDGSDFVFDPEHGGGHVADDGPGAASICGDDDHADDETSEFAIVNEFPNDGDHDDGGRKIVEDGGEEEGEPGEDPEEGGHFFGADALGDEGEAFVGIDEFDDGHGAHEKKEDLGDFGDGVKELTFDQIGAIEWFGVGVVMKIVEPLGDFFEGEEGIVLQGVEGPAEATDQES